jgi:predicted DNA-binding transcriptional regulator
MNRDRIIGLLIFIGSILGIIIYAWLLFFISPIIVIQITLFIAVSAILAILSWIGYTLATTPPPKPIEEIEKELEGELKKLEVETRTETSEESKREERKS